MAVGGLMARIRYWDNRLAGWMMRHFYILFFEIILVAIFVVFFIITVNVINIGADTVKTSTSEKLLLMQSFNSLLITLLFLLNSFWMLYVFNGILRIRAVLKEIGFSLTTKRRNES